MEPLYRRLKEVQSSLDLPIRHNQPEKAIVPATANLPARVKGN